MDAMRTNVYTLIVVTVFRLESLSARPPLSVGGDGASGATRLYVQLFLGLKAGWISKRSSLDAAIEQSKRAAPPANEQREGTATGKAGSSGGVVRDLMAKCQNALHASTHILLLTDFQKLMRLMVDLAQPHLKWYHEQNCALRSPDESAGEVLQGGGPGACHGVLH